MAVQPGQGAGEAVGGKRMAAAVQGWTPAGLERMAARPEQLPLVLLPGTLCDGRVFAPLISRLAGPNPFVLSISSGSSTAELAEQLLDLAPPRFALAGFSLGGMVALEMAHLAPRRIAGLALLNTSPLAVAAEAHAPRRKAVAEAARLGLPAYVRQVLWPNYVAPGALAHDELRDSIIDMAQALGPAVFARQTEVALSRTDRRAALRRLTSPTLLLTGQHDRLCAPAMVLELASGLSNARAAILSDVGHFALLEDPDKVALHLAEWLDDIYAREAGASLDIQDGKFQ